MLSLYAVDKSFGHSKILKSIDMQPDKKTYGLLGPNGAGKTTLMRCITGLYPLSAGKIEFNGSDISKDKSFQSHIGYLPQKFGLYKELTAFEMMEMLADLKGVSREKIGDEAKKYIELVGLQDQLDKKVKTLSGGMIRRLGVAQALLGEPDIIIFDEPTAGLDPEAPALQEYCFKARGRAHDNHLHAHCRGRRKPLRRAGDNKQRHRGGAGHMRRNRNRRRGQGL